MPSTLVAAVPIIVGAMKRKSIFKKDSQKIDAAFIEAGHPEKILLVPLDFAKSTHYACFCDGLGRYQRQAFTVKNNSEGLDYLVSLIEAARKSRSIRNKQHVIVGGEDSASYTRNFMQRLKELGYLAVRLSACEVHRQAESMDSLTDKTALRAIAKTMLNRDAQLIDGHDIYTELRALTRQRRRIVRLNTAVKNRIHTHADRLFPGFLSKESALAPFSQASLELMSKPSFGAASISRKNEKILARQLRRQGTPRSSEVATALKQQAKGTIFADKSSAHMSAHILAGELQLFRALQSNLEELDKGCARLLARTPEALVTSIKGIGITLISSICAESGSLAQVTRADSLNAYAGIVPKVKQTGGPESEAKIRGRRRSFNRVLKDYTLQAGNHLYLHGPEELMQDAVHRKLGGRAVDTAMARRFLRIARALCKQHYIYLPSYLRGQNASAQARAEYILDSWPALLVKWKRLGVHQEAFAPERPLGQWRLLMQEIYDIELSL
jgi:transposase